MPSSSAYNLTVLGLGWRWHKWIAFIITFVNFLAVLFFVPETRYERKQWAGSPTASNVALEKTATSQTEQVETIPKKTYLQELSLWSGTPSGENLPKMFVRPLPMIAYPAVLFAFLGYAVTLAWVVAINILNSFVLQAPPYNWKPSIVRTTIGVYVERADLCRMV
jgi:hypothetical protein